MSGAARGRAGPDREPRREIPVARPSFGVEEERLVLETLRSGWVAQGPRVAEFEERFALAVGAEHAVATSSCTTALFLALHALGIGPGDEVITPSLTYIAGVNAIAHCGARPVFADVEARTYNLDPDRLAAAVTPRTRAVMVVHQLGLPADLPALEASARRHGLAVIEDAACALGSRRDGEPIGASGHPVCFSFHPRKLITTGEGGMVATGDTALAARLRRLRHQGMSVSDLERHRAERVVLEEYPEIGWNFRLSDLQAALGVAQLARLDGLLTRRRALAARYASGLAAFPEVVLPFEPEGAEPNYQSYILRLAGASREARNRVLDGLLRRGVSSRRGLMAVHREAPYAAATPAAGLPESERADAQTLLLPIYADLPEDDQDYVLRQLRAALDEVGPGPGAGAAEPPA